ncbi:MAG: hemerythrin domain-containing protein [Pseudomonadales bacterium]
MAAKRRSSQDKNRTRVMQRLHDEHGYIGKLRRAMFDEVSRAGRRGQIDVALIRDMMRYLMEFPDKHHHPLEDRIFEKLLEQRSSVRSDVLELMAEHKDLAAESQYLYHKLNAVYRGDEKLQPHMLRSTIEEFLKFYAEHVKREETIVFPAAQKQLSADDWRDIAKAFKEVDDPVFESGKRGDFAPLRARLENGMDVAVAGITFAEMIGVYSFLGAAGALAEGAAELHQLNQEQWRNFHQGSRTAITEANSVRDALDRLVTANSLLLQRGLLGYWNISRRTAKASLQPLSSVSRSLFRS